MLSAALLCGDVMVVGDWKGLACLWGGGWRSVLFCTVSLGLGGVLWLWLSGRGRGVGWEVEVLG